MILLQQGEEVGKQAAQSPAKMPFTGAEEMFLSGVGLAMIGVGLMLLAIWVYAKSPIRVIVVTAAATDTRKVKHGRFARYMSFLPPAFDQLVRRAHRSGNDSSGGSSGDALDNRARRVWRATWLSRRRGR